MDNSTQNTRNTRSRTVHQTGGDTSHTPGASGEQQHSMAGKGKSRGRRKGKGPAKSTNQETEHQDTASIAVNQSNNLAEVLSQSIEKSMATMQKNFIESIKSMLPTGINSKKQAQLEKYQSNDEEQETYSDEDYQEDPPSDKEDVIWTGPGYDEHSYASNNLSNEIRTIRRRATQHSREHTRNIHSHSSGSSSSSGPKGQKRKSAQQNDFIDTLDSSSLQPDLHGPTPNKRRNIYRNIETEDPPLYGVEGALLCGDGVPAKIRQKIGKHEYVDLLELDFCTLKRGGREQGFVLDREGGGGPANI